MNSGGLGRVRPRAKYRTAFRTSLKRIRFRFYIGILTLLAGLGIMIFDIIKSLFKF